MSLKYHCIWISLLQFMFKKRRRKKAYMQLNNNEYRFSVAMKDCHIWGAWVAQQWTHRFITLACRCDKLGHILAAFMNVLNHPAFWVLSLHDVGIFFSSACRLLKVCSCKPACVCHGVGSCGKVLCMSVCVCVCDSSQAAGSRCLSTARSLCVD